MYLKLLENTCELRALKCRAGRKNGTAKDWNSTTVVLNQRSTCLLKSSRARKQDERIACTTYTCRV